MSRRDGGVLPSHRSVVVAVGETVDPCVLDWGVQFATAADRRLTLIHAAHSSSGMPTVAAAHGLCPPDADLRARASYLEAVAATIRESHPELAITARTVAAPPLSAISSATRPGDALVVGPRRRPGWLAGRSLAIDSVLRTRQTLLHPRGVFRRHGPVVVIVRAMQELPATLAAATSQVATHARRIHVVLDLPATVTDEQRRDATDCVQAALDDARAAHPRRVLSCEVTPQSADRDVCLSAIARLIVVPGPPPGADRRYARWLTDQLGRFAATVLVAQ